jgi:3-hexulose-6-phosphate synthase
MKLQLALDGTLAQALTILESAHSFIDQIEIGTPLVLREGVAAVAAVNQRYPGIPVLADFKIADAGYEEASIAFEAGATVVTVLGLAADPTVREAVEAARRYGGQIMADLIQATDLVGRSRKLLDLGCHVLCVHTGYDLQAHNQSPLDALTTLRDALPDAPLAVAGGIHADTIAAIAALHPDLVIVGGAITRADNPAAAARTLKQRMQP